MKAALRVAGSVSIVLCVVFLVLAVSGGGEEPRHADQGGSGELTCRLDVRDKVISGAYKVYGLADSPVGLWLAKAVFRNETGGVIRDLRVRYNLGEYAEWSPWETYPALVPTQTVVDLYHPILSSRCAKLTASAPAELRMECEYTDAAGQTHKFERSERLTMLSRREFIFTDLSFAEQTGSFQDMDTNSPMMAAWVTPQDTAVTNLAALANERAGGAGASMSDENCIKVMRELYEIMRAINITYQSPASQVAPGKSFNITHIQTLQYPRDTIQKRSGTCIDLAMLYASMLHSVGIKPLLVSLDGHCFPMGVTRSGQYIPVESTCVGGGGRDSNDFETAVQIAAKQWEELQKTGRFNIVDCRECWGAGISPAELDPLPPDILNRWGIPEMLEQADQQGPGNRQEQQRERTGPSNGIVAGIWDCAISQPDGSQLQCVAQVTRQGGNVQIVYQLEYQFTDMEGIVHNAQEQNTFVGTVQGQQVFAQCQRAVWVLDGQQVPPEGLPYQLQLNVSPDGRTAQGSVVNAAGSGTQLVMQAR